MEIRVQDLMVESGVKFGTSGARGLAADMTDKVCYIYTKGFLQYLESQGDITPGMMVAVAGDFRPSTDQIMAAVGKAASDSGYSVINCGKVPSPAVALLGIKNRIPAVMVTGSHIPADRNGIKFNKCDGEILKEDEAGIREQNVVISDGVFNLDGSFAGGPVTLPEVDEEAKKLYINRYLDFFENDCLMGVQVGIYQHSAVGRDIMVDIISGLGATVTPLGRSDAFIPVDTEAIRQEDVELASGWAKEHGFTTIISTDGDSDRPLISDEQGNWLRGDVAGVLCAKYLGADSVSTPVSCNSVVEKSGWFKQVKRTQIGSPFVIASMIEAAQEGANMVVGYEANGGFLTYSSLKRSNNTLVALPTRDALILHIAIILLAKDQGRTISELVNDLPQRFTASDRLKDYPQEKSSSVLDRFSASDDRANKVALELLFGSLSGKAESIDRTDGVRVTFTNQEVIHLRPSGNAPEFRCYTEAATQERAVQLNGDCMTILRNL